MKPSIKQLGEVLYAPSQYIIPVFQRNYRWDRPQWEKLWASLTEIQKPEKTGNHFMGFLVFVPGLAQPGQHTRFHLIDGQQRLTTSSILLAALRNVARVHGHNDLADEIHNDYLVHPRKKGEEHFRLLPKEHDQTSYLALVSGSGVPTGRMADALAYFEQQLEQQAQGDPVRLRRLFDVVCQRLEFMCATLEAENAYNIFKSLNSTGVPLGPSDLIRNFVFMHVLPDEQDEFDRELWAPLESGFAGAGGRLDEERFSKFFRDVLMMDGRYVQPKDTFSTFESRYEATGFSPKVLAQELRASAGNHAVIAGQAADASAEVTAALAGLNLLESSTTYPLLLALFGKRGQGQLDSAQLARCIQMLRGFILRRFVCGDSSRGYGQMFVRALAKEQGDLVAALETYLLERGWPDDRRFIEAFTTFPLYKRGYTKEVLETLERARGHKEQADLRVAQIEHVMPQTLRDEWVELLGDEALRIHADWLHRPGNLTLSAYNQEMGNQPFATKRERFAQSNVVLTRELAEFDAWGEAQIKARGEQLAREAALIWTGPLEPFVAPQEEAGDELGEAPRYVLRRKFWTGFLDHMANAHPEVPAFDARQFKTIRLSSGVRHIGFELRHMLRPGEVAIDVYFWREASLPVWERLQANPTEINALIDDSWTFGRPADGSNPAWMVVSLTATSDDEAEWPTLYGWLGQKMALLYGHVAPRLRQEMASEGAT